MAKCNSLLYYIVPNAKQKITSCPSSIQEVPLRCQRPSLPRPACTSHQLDKQSLCPPTKTDYKILTAPWPCPADPNSSARLALRRARLPAPQSCPSCSSR